MLPRVRAPAAGRCSSSPSADSATNGERFIVGELIAGGSGAGRDRDGVDVIETDASNCMNLPVEALEMDAPIARASLALRRIPEGPESIRGGLGVVREYEVLADDDHVHAIAASVTSRQPARRDWKAGWPARAIGHHRADGRVEDSLEARDRCARETAS